MIKKELCIVGVTNIAVVVVQKIRFIGQESFVIEVIGQRESIHFCIFHPMVID